MSPDLVLVVKSVVADNVKKQRITDEDSSSVVIQRVPESKDDLIKVRDLLKLVYCADSLLNVFCMVKYNTFLAGRKLYRSLKVILQSRGDRDYVLKSAKFIVTSTEKNLPGIYITKLLTADEMRTIKKLRLQCHDMNAAESAKSPDGRDRFVVIDNKIMKRQGDGTLGPCMQPVFKSSCSQLWQASLLRALVDLLRSKMAAINLQYI